MQALVCLVLQLTGRRETRGDSQYSTTAIIANGLSRGCVF